MPPLLSALLLGCAQSLTPAPVPRSAEPETEAGTDPGWKMGEPSTCEGPLPLRWIDQSQRLGGVDEEEEGPVEGSLSLWERDGAWWVSELRGLDHSTTWTLDGEPVSQSWTDPPLRQQVLDLDEDGAPDLLTLGSGIHLQSDWQGLEEDPEILYEGTFGEVFKDAILFDLDGDGRRELVFAEWGLAAGSGVATLVRGSDSWGSPTSLQEGYEGLPFDLLLLDLDEDDQPDAYLCNDHGAEFGGNLFLHNLGSGGMMAASLPGAEVVADCMGISAGDIDGDGRMDLALATGTGPMLLLGDAEGFVDVSATWGLPRMEDGPMPWGTALADLDNDGMQDLLLAVSDFSNADLNNAPAWALRQQEPGSFEDKAEEWGLPTQAATRVVLTHDLNGDGVLDMLWSDLHSGPHLFESEGCTAEEWIEIEAPEATIVRVEAGGLTWTLPVLSQPGFAVSGPPVAHFGLGEVGEIDRIVAHVPWVGEVQLQGPISTRQRLRWAAPQDESGR